MYLAATKTDGSGISCDLCRLEVRDEFTYYSFDISRVKMINSRAINEKKEASIDVCERCYSSISDKVVKNYKPVVVGICCDLTGKHFKGNVEYYKINVDKAIVLGKDVNVDRRHLEIIADPEVFKWKTIPTP